MDLKTLKQELLKNSKFRKEYYNKKDLVFEISEMIRELRIKSGLTQKELAKRVGTKQPAIARIENGIGSLPTLSFLQKIAKALGTYLIPPKFASLERSETVETEMDFRKYIKEEWGIEDVDLIMGVIKSLKTSFSATKSYSNL